jgi:hypothetical protein
VELELSERGRESEAMLEATEELFFANNSVASLITAKLNGLLTTYTKQTVFLKTPFKKLPYNLLQFSSSFLTDPGVIVGSSSTFFMI